MKITDLKCAVIGKNPIVRIVTNDGISGYGEVEHFKPYLKPHVLQFRDTLIGEDPTDVERCMLKIRQRGAFKPYGAAVSVIEHALWDVAGKAAGLPVYKLLGGKVRDKVRTYNGSLRAPLGGVTPEHYARDCKRMAALPEGFDIIKQGIAFHSPMKREFEGFFYGTANANPFHGALDTGAHHRTRHEPHDRLRRRDEGSARRLLRAGARLRAGLDATRRAAIRSRGRDRTICCGSRIC